MVMSQFLVFRRTPLKFHFSGKPIKYRQYYQVDQGDTGQEDITQRYGIVSHTDLLLHSICHETIMAVVLSVLTKARVLLPPAVATIS